MFVGDQYTDIFNVAADSGEVVWKVASERSWVACVQNGVLLVTNPTWTKGRGLSVETGGTLYALSGSSLCLWRGRWMLVNSDGLAVLDATTGRPLETRAPLPVAPSDAGFTRIDGDVMLYQAEENTEVVAYDLSRQELLWKRPLQREIAERCGCEVGAVRLRRIEPSVFLAHMTSRIVVGCSLRDGSILWDMAVPFNSPVVPHRDRVYVMLAQEGRESSPRLVSLEALTGARVYDVVQTGLNVLDLASQGTVYEEYIGFGTRAGLVGLFQLADGALAWSYRYKVQLYTPVMTDERLCICADDGNLLIFDAAA